MRPNAPKIILIGIVALLAIVAAFYFSPVPTGLDSIIFHEALKGFFWGVSPYQDDLGVTHNQGYFYAPWASLFIAPLAFFEARITWALTNALSILAVALVAKRWNLSLVHTVLLLLSPPMVYILWMGQVDALLLMTIFIPRELWLLAALAKPQTSIGLGFAVLRRSPRSIIASLLIFLSVFLLSLLLFGNWPLQVAEMSKIQFSGMIRQNLLNIWPLNFIVFVTLVSMAIEQDDERLYISASPFFLKYASTGSFIGLIAAVFTALKTWQAALVVFVWWFVLFVR